MPSNHALFEHNLSRDPHDHTARAQTVAAAELDAMMRRIRQATARRSRR